MLQDILIYISQLDPLLIYIVLFFFAFIENVFPPSPSDVVVVFGASVIAHTTIGFLPVLIITVVGSALGFMIMYYVGKVLGENVLRKGKLKFITPKDLERTDKWFAKYGYKLIVANRFLPGTRSVISFFSGVHELNVIKTFVYASISALLWNSLIIYLGMLLGHKIELVDYYLSAYSNIVGVITVLAAGFIGIKLYLRRKKKKQSN